MSRRRKVILVLVFAPLALVGFLLVLAFLSPVQTALARKALAGQGEVERLSVGLGGAELSGLVLQQPGVKISVPSFRADLPLVGAALGSIELGALVAHDIVIDYDPVAAAAHAASQPASEPAPASAPFAGILHGVQLPALRVDGLDLAGELRVAGPQPISARFTLTGGGVAAGKEGAIELKVTAKAASGADVTTTIALRPTLDADGQLAALVVALDATARGFLPNSKPAALRGEVALAREGTAETWRVRVLAADMPLIELDTRWAPGAADLPGKWKLDFADTDLSPFVPFLALPKLQLSGAGQLAIENAERLSLSGELSFAADGVESLGLPALGAVGLATRFDLVASATEAKVNAFRLALDSAGAPVLAVEARQAFTYDLASGKLASARAEDELLNVSLLDVPAAWVALFVPELSIGRPSGGAWSVRPEGDGFTLTATAPLVLSGVRYGTAEQPLLALDALRIEGLRARQNSAGLEASLDKLRLVADGVDLVTLKASATRAPGASLKARAELGAQLAALADQPVLRGQTRLSAGRALLLLDASVGESMTANSELRLSGLRADGNDLPDVLLQVEATQDAAGGMTLKLPLTVTNRSPARVSDLEFSATVKSDPSAAAGGRVVAAKLLSQILHVGDLQAFAAIAAPGSPSEAPAPAPEGKPVPAPAPAYAPLWAGVSGELELALARIVYAPGIEVLDTKGRVALTKDALSLERLRVLLGTGGAVNLSGGLRWLPATRGYALEADLAGADLAVGPLLKALNPSEAAPLEGTYTLTGKVSGEGADPAAAAAGASAEFALTGRQGVVRALDLETSRYARAGNVVSGLAGLAGALSGNAEVAKRAAQVTALNNITRQFANLAYDELTLTARRGADGAIEIGTLRLLSPNLKLDGAGAVANVANRSFMEQPLKLQFALGAREALARDLATLGLAELPPADAAPGEFAALVEPVVLEGTLNNISTAQFSRLLSRALGGR